MELSYRLQVTGFMKTIKTANPNDIKFFVEKIQLPMKNSHKGQNGKMLIVGGSQLFHSASLWSAEVASHFVDMVHYCSTEENNEIFLSLKKKFRNGIVVSRKDVDSYAEEDDVILVGPGLERTKETKDLVDSMLKNHSTKRFVLDAGALQMMNTDLLKKLTQPAIVTPHQKEFEGMFKFSITDQSLEQIAASVRCTAEEEDCIILLKAIHDFVSDGSDEYVIEGGNQGLTKGGTGDILAGLAASFYVRSDGLSSAICASYVLKKTADELFKSRGYWYNNSDILDTIPKVVNSIFL